MKHIKILMTSVLLIALSIVSIQSCASDTNDNYKSSDVTLDIEKSTQLNQESQFWNLSTITKEAYLAMSPKRKADFYQAYVHAFRNGGSCSCNNCCTVNCPSGTKPNCQCGSGECSCQCEPYGSGGIAMRFAIQKNNDGSVILTDKVLTKKSITNFLESDLPNAKKIAHLFDTDPLFKRKTNGIIILTPKEFFVLESKFQALMEHYTIEQYFKVEYGI